MNNMPNFFPPYEAYGFSIEFASILHSKGMSADYVNRLLTCPLSLLDEFPEKIHGAIEVASRIIKHVHNDYKFLIFADYDVDGMVSGYIMTTFLREIGADVYCHYPEREDGYGLSMDFVKAIDRSNNNWCIITVDNGITANEPIAYAVENGIDVIVTDHHEPSAQLPNCLICDPCIDGNYTYLCGAGVVWKICLLMEDILEKNYHSKVSITETFLPYLGIATIADVMPMSDENRAIVKLALDNINGSNPDIYFDIMKEMFSIRDMSVKDISFTIAPTLNGASRMGDTQCAATSFYEYDGDDLRDTFIKLNDYNKARKSLQEKALKEVDKKNYSDDSIVLFDASDYPAGIYGIIAAKLSDAYGAPAIVYSAEGNELHGSCRAPEGIDIKSLINKQASIGNAVEALGHAEACGCTLLKDKLDDFKKGIEESIKEIAPNLIDKAEIKEDITITVDKMTPKLLTELNQVPFFKDEPVFLIKDIPFEVVTPFKNKNHLVIHMDNQDDKVALAWNAAPNYQCLKHAKRINVWGHLTSAGFSSKYLGIKMNQPIIMITHIEEA